jgi:ATP-dependent RNA helicase RhlE
MSFDRLGLTPDLLRAVADQGYTEPTPVQAEAIPLVLERRDLLANAQTGTGKTAAFVLPIVQILHATRPAGALPAHQESRNGRDRAHRPVRVLVLAPTRELAIQVEESVRTYGAHRPIRSTTIYGGVGFDQQVRKLRAGAELVVATPGRLLDHVRQGTIDLSRVEILVLDEADRMLDMGFLPDIRRILDLLPQERQSLLFSATFSDEIRRLASSLLRDPATVQVAPRNTAAELVRQVVYPVDRERKRELLSHLIRSGRIYSALVFTRTKHGANHLAEQLERDGIAAAAIHGNKSQAQRVRALAMFKANKVAVLVATDIAARGIDIDALPHVVNFELPMVAEDYVHRIGRTGRAGADGEAISLVCVDESRLLRDIEDVLGHRVPTEVIEGYAPDPRIRPQPVLKRSGQGRQGPAPRQSGPMHRQPVHAARTPAPMRHAAPGTHIGMHGGAPVRHAGRPEAGRPVHAAVRPAYAAARPEAVRPAHGAATVAPRGGRPQAPNQSSERPWRPNAPQAAADRPYSPMPGERFARDGGGHAPFGDRRHHPAGPVPSGDRRHDRPAPSGDRRHHPAAEEHVPARRPERVAGPRSEHGASARQDRSAPRRAHG